MQNKNNSQEEQLDLGFQEPFSNKLKKKKYQLGIFFIKLRTNSLLKNPAMWIFVALTVSLLSTQYYYYTNYFEKLPSKISLFKIPENLELRLVDSEYMLTILLVCALLALVSFFLSMKIFSKSKPISIVILGNLFVSTLLVTTVYIRIFSLYVF